MPIDKSVELVTPMDGELEYVRQAGQAGQAGRESEIDLDLGEEGVEEVEAPQSASLSDSEAAAAARRIKQIQSGSDLSDIAKLILQVDSRAVGDTDAQAEKLLAEGRRRLAINLGCQVSDLEEIVESYGDEWQQYVLYARVKMGMDSVMSRDVTWDSLESAILRKLDAVLQNPAIRISVPEMIAMARLANQAIRGNRTQKEPERSGQTNIFAPQMAFFPGAPADGVLPSGDLGRIDLPLSNRVRRQLEQAPAPGQVVEGVTYRKTLDSINMLTLEEIQQAEREFNK